MNEPRSRAFLWFAIWMLWVSSCGGFGLKDIQQDYELRRLESKISNIETYCRAK